MMDEHWGVPFFEILPLYCEKAADVRAYIRIMQVPLSEYEIAYSDRDEVLATGLEASIGMIIS